MDDRRQWDQDGYVVLRGAVPADAVAAYTQDIARVREGLLVRAPGDEHASLAVHAEPDAAGAIDPYAISDVARTVLLAEPVVAFLSGLFEAQPLLFDAAETTAGAPDSDPYRDATYVAVAEEPEALVGALVALGDTTLALVPGSQTLATTPFSGRYRHHNAERDGDAALARHREELTAAVAGHDRGTETVALQPGDVVLWQADLVHEPPNGGPALGAHFCPARAHPSWFAYRPERARHAEFGGAWLTTQHYDLVDAVAEDEAADPEPLTAPQIEHITDALEAHDDRPPDAPSPPPPAPDVAHRRSGGGLVGSVRDLMGRRHRGR
jgi:hypothetical protein